MQNHASFNVCSVFQKNSSYSFSSKTQAEILVAFFQVQDLAVLDSGDGLRQHLHPGPHELGQVPGGRLPRGVNDFVSKVPA